MQKNTLILLSHPDYKNSIANKFLIDRIKQNSQISIHHLDANRENGIFNLKEEFELLKKATAIVLQFPLYWYSAPSSLKDWEDQVLSPIVYGNDNFIEGKPAQIVFTAGSRESAFRAGDIVGYTPSEMLRPLQMTINASKMQYLTPLGIFEARDKKKEDLEKIALNYQNLILKL